MRLCASVTLLALAFAGHTVVTGAETTADGGTSIPALIVTATKVDTEIGQVPASIALIPGQEISDRGDRSLDDLVDHVANVHAINLGTHTTYPVIRGISALSDESPATIQVDGIAPRSLGLDSLLDVERVEILRGPQGTLYGRNSIPGVVNVVTRDPGRIWEGYGQVDASSNRTLSGAAAAGGPLGEDLGVRFAVRGARSDGFRTNVLTNDDHAAESRDVQGQGKLVYAVGRGWTAKLTGQALRYRTTGDQFAPLALAAEHETSNSDAGEFSNRLFASGLTLEQRSDDRTFTAITGGAVGRDVFDLDTDFSSLPGNTLRKVTDNRQVSQEVRYSGGKGLRSWVVGLYAARDAQDVAYTNVVTPALNPQLPFTYTSNSRGQQVQQDAAAFGEAGLPLGPGWTFTVGLRLDHTRTAVDLVNQDNLSPGFSYVDDRQDTTLLPKGVLSYAWSDEVLTWLSATRGFKAGGFNLTPNSLAEIQGGYEPESAMSYELGQRISALDQALNLALSGFITDYRNKQVTILEPPQTYLIRNAARATIVGVESDNQARLAPGVDLLLGAGALRATFNEYQADPASDLTGNHLPMAPSYDAYLGTQWRHESGLIARVDLTAIGSFYADDRNQVTQDAYRILGARVGYEAEDWAVYLWGRNLSDSGYFTRASVSPTAGAVAVSGEPRTIGVTATGRF
jgi:iron complex outermembrane recepter protein